jgi:hypothetical protein
MKKRTIKLLMPVLMGVLVTFGSCKKEGCTDPLAKNYDSKAKKDDGSCELEIKDTEAPVISIFKPEDNAEYEKGDTVFIEIKVTDNVEMHEVVVHIHRHTTDEEVFHLDRHSHSKEVNINSYWVVPNDLGANEKFELEVEAEDDAGNKSKKVHEFYVK